MTSGLIILPIYYLLVEPNQRNMSLRHYCKYVVYVTCLQQSLKDMFSGFYVNY